MWLISDLFLLILSCYGFLCVIVVSLLSVALLHMDDIKKSAKYSDDAISLAMSNLTQKLKRREEMSIWGPVELPAKSKKVFRQRNYFHAKMNENETTSDKENFSCPRNQLTNFQLLENGSVLLIKDGSSVSKMPRESEIEINIPVSKSSEVKIFPNQQEPNNKNLSPQKEKIMYSETSDSFQGLKTKDQRIDRGKNVLRDQVLQWLKDIKDDRQVELLSPCQNNKSVIRPKEPDKDIPETSSQMLPEKTNKHSCDWNFQHNQNKPFPLTLPRKTDIPLERNESGNHLSKVELLNDKGLYFKIKEEYPENIKVNMHAGEKFTNRKDFMKKDPKSCKSNISMDSPQTKSTADIRKVDFENCKRKFYRSDGALCRSFRSTEEINYPHEETLMSLKLPSEKNLQMGENAFAKRNINSENAKLLAYDEKGMGSAKRTNPTVFCIKITDNEDKKFFELMANFSAISRLKKVLPDIPEIGSGYKKIEYSAEAMNIILGFVIHGDFNSGKMPSPHVGVEVLAAAQSWRIRSVSEKFQNKFLQEVLTPENAHVIFSQAYHFNLTEICDACKTVALGNIVPNNFTSKRKQKICFVSISTYIEPLEITFSIQPVKQGVGKQNLMTCFERHVVNTITFGVTKGSYTIKGFQIQLNEEENGKSKSKIEIDYCVKNVSNNKVVEHRTEEKPVRPINIIYFKNDLILNPKEVGEIRVEVDTKQNLCSVGKEETILFQNHDGKFNLTMESSFKLKSADMKLFVVGKLFYHSN